jgi:hypothetical protein
MNEISGAGRRMGRGAQKRGRNRSGSGAGRRDGVCGEGSPPVEEGGGTRRIIRPVDCGMNSDCIGR